MPMDNCWAQGWGRWISFTFLRGYLALPALSQGVGALPLPYHADRSWVRVLMVTEDCLRQMAIPPCGEPAFRTFRCHKNSPTLSSLFKIEMSQASQVHGTDKSRASVAEGRVMGGEWGQAFLSPSPQLLWVLKEPEHSPSLHSAAWTLPGGMLLTAGHC